MLESNFIYYAKWHFVDEVWVLESIVKKLFADISKLDDNYRLYPIGITPIDYNDKLTNWIYGGIENGKVIICKSKRRC